MKFKLNHSEKEACLEGKYSGPLVSRIFATCGVALPKIFWQRKITDYNVMAYLDGSGSGADMTSLTESALAHHTEGSGSTSRAPPSGTGESPAPALPP